MIIDFYTQTRIAPNTFVENISDYLDPLLTLTVVNVTIPKALQSNEPTFSVRVDMISEEDVVAIKQVNYAEIRKESDDAKCTLTKLYCFVTNVTYINESTYEVSFAVDYVNSYQDYLLNTSNFKKVTINRRHKNRFDSQGFRVYDKFDEGLGDIATLQEQHVNMQQEGAITTDQHGYIQFEQPYAINGETAGGQLSFTSIAYRTGISSPIPYYFDTYVQAVNVPTFKTAFSTTKPFMAYSTDGSPVKLVTSDGSVIIGQAIVYWCSSDDSGYYGLANRVDSTTFQMTSYEVNQDWIQKTGMIYYMSDNGKFVLSGLDALVKAPLVGAIFTPEGILGNSSISSITKTYTSMATTQYCNKNTDSNIRKTIELPFTLFKQPEQLINFGGRIAISPDNDYTGASITYIYDDKPDTSKKGQVMQRDKVYESKLYGSYVRDHFISYDSDIFTLQPEFSSSYQSKGHSFTAYMYTPTDFTDGVAIRVVGFKPQELYGDWLISKRSNQPTMWTNEQLDYARTGYNYDVKMRNYQSKQAWTSAAFNMGSAVVGGAGGVISGAIIGAKKGNTQELNAQFANKYGKQLLATGIVGAANAAISIASTVVSTIQSERQANAALAQKRLQVQNKASSVAQSGDLVMLHLYSNNALFYNVFGPTAEVEKAVWDKFYYTGYADASAYDIMPDYKTRQYFNFVQADVTYTMPDDTIVDQNIYGQLQAAFSSGITFCWNYNDTWLIKDYTTYENWEV